MKPTNITKCRECGGTSLTWDTVNRARNGIQQNRLNTRDVECVFFLGCDNCSETLSVVSVDRVAAALNASAEPSAPVERDGLEGVEDVARSIVARIQARAALSRK